MVGRDPTGATSTNSVTLWSCGGLSCETERGIKMVLEKTLMLGKIEGRRRRGRQRMRWLDGITDSMLLSSVILAGSLSLSEPQGPLRADL